ncbi:MAG: hypothetical protein HF982_10035 [Desulfobacteraceae bacterium]|nr:hypothetical protein [Desulfobacteraceae bacterium]MBC2719906.1 hypothetical protein [Desulfobacteraceae bacterium]
MFSCTLIGLVSCTIEYGRPLTGLLAGAAAGLVLSFLTAAALGSLESGGYYDPPGKGSNWNDELDSVFKAPYYFLYIWGGIFVAIGACLGIILLVGGAIALIVYLISKGL